MSFEPVTWERAEQLAGRRLDRRRRYAFDGRELAECASWTELCSGCVVYGCTDAGLGCHECGFTGRRRIRMWLPVQIQQAHRDCARRTRAREDA